MKTILSWYYIVAPGILVAATGVGAGDLIFASFAGSNIGLTVLWVAAVGAVLKWMLTEGLARWQMATNTTLLEGFNASLASFCAMDLFNLSFNLVAWSCRCTYVCMRSCRFRIFPVRRNRYFQPDMGHFPCSSWFSSCITGRIQAF